MKYISFCPFLLGLFWSVFAFGQNLVPNPSFEEYLECPYSTAEFQSQVANWSSFSVTPDYFNSCSNDLEGFAGVPDNAWGHQYPVTGNAYAGVIGYTHTTENEREYIACEIPPITIGETYYVMFYISHFDGGDLDYLRCAIDRFGLKFFKDPNFNSETNPYTPQNNADIEFNYMFADSTNWQLVEGWFTADQAYDWIALGNFYDDAHTDTLQLGNPENEFNECYAIYYIDNICISTDPIQCDYLLSLNTIEKRVNVGVYPNPAISNLSIESKTSPINNINIFSSLGNLVYQKVSLFNNMTHIDIAHWASGMYFLEIELDNGLFYQTKIIKR